MIHIIIFCYFVTILIGVSAGTIQWIEFKSQKKDKYRPMSPFVTMLLVLNLFDLFIYYNGNILHNDVNVLLLSLGDFLIALLVLIWLRLLMDKDETTNAIERKVRWYVGIYVAIWIASAIFLKGEPWIRLLIDLPMMIILVAGSISFIRIGRKNGDGNDLTGYKIVILVFMILNYLSYFISESGAFPRYDPYLMNATVIYWLVINVANVWILYRKYFGEKEKEPQMHVRNLENAIESVRNQHELTARETEILAEIYNGKTNTQIGEALFISESTVKAHIYNIFRKLEVKNRIEVVCMIRNEQEKDI